MRVPKSERSTNLRWFGLAALSAAVVATVLSGLAGPAAAAPATMAAPANVAAAANVPAALVQAAPAVARPDDEPAPAASSETDPQAAEAAAATPPTSKCRGAIALGRVYSCDSLTGTAHHRYTFTTTADEDTVYAVVTRGSGDIPSAALTNADGNYLCNVGGYATSCTLGAAGTYTIDVYLYFGGSGDYLISVQSMKAPSACRQLGAGFFSFASAGLHLDVPAGTAATCLGFDQPVGAVLYPRLSTTGDVRGTVLDGAYQGLCPIQSGGGLCQLATPGPYRIFLQETYGNAAVADLKLPRLSQAAGCVTLPLATFGDPGTDTATATVVPQGLACHRLRPTAAGPLLVRINPSQGLGWTIYDDAGQPVCSSYDSINGCAVPAAGTYTLIVLNSGYSPVTYQVAAVALYRNAGCAPGTPTTWSPAALVAHQTSPVQTNCQPFNGKAGDRILTYGAPDVYNNLPFWLVDGAGTWLCRTYEPEDGCVLPADGQYRVISYLSTWDGSSTDLTYKLQVRRLNNPVGCPAVQISGYDTAPPAGGIRCRVFNVSNLGPYLLQTVDSGGYRGYGQIYDAAGLKVACGTICTLPAAGRYTMVLGGNGRNEVIDNDLQYSFTFRSATPTNCPAVGDALSPLAPRVGTFTGVGEADCLRLASPAGASIYALEAADATGAARPTVTVLDATGQFVCESSWSLRQYPCQLTGTAPFVAVLTMPDGVTAGDYRSAFVRLDGAPTCPTLPKDATGVTVNTSATAFAACSSIAGDQHAASERFTYTRTAGQGLATLTVYGVNGQTYCSTGRWETFTFTCTLPAGPVTVILRADAADATYQITRADPA